MEAIVLGGMGIAGIVTCVIAGYLFHNRLATQADHAQDREFAAEEALKNEQARASTLEKNNAALDVQISSLKTSNKVLTAQLAAANKEADALATTVKNHAPSALPDAVLGALDRLRASVQQVPVDPAAATAGDPGGGEAGPVHEEAAQGTAGRP